MSGQPNWKICLSDLDFGKEEEEAVLDVLRSRWLTMGPRTEEFEKRVAELTGAEHAVFVSSCTSALYLMLAAVGIKPGDEVLVPSMTFVATVNVILNCGATPVFCDVVSPELPLIDPKEVRANLSPATRAVFTVDYAGYPCNYDAIAVALADYEAAHPSVPPRPRDEKSIYLFEDAAHGIGGLLDEQRSLGNCGDAGAFSFFSNKNLVTGEGGMVITNQEPIAERARLLRRHGLTHSTWERHTGGRSGYNVVSPGWNFRPTELQAALGLAQVGKLEANQNRRHDLVRHYHERLGDIEEVTIPFAHIKTWHFPACHIFPILLPNMARRERVRERLQAAGIQTSHHYPPVHLFEYFQKAVPTAQLPLPRTEEFAARELTLPLFPKLTFEEVDLVAATIKEALAR